MTRNANASNSANASGADGSQDLALSRPVAVTRDEGESMVLISGEAGLDKSCLLSEAANRANEIITSKHHPCLNDQSVSFLELLAARRAALFRIEFSRAN